MVFHIPVLLGIAAVKAVIKSNVDAPDCGVCDKEMKKYWVGARIVFMCGDCQEDEIAALIAAKVGLKILTLGVSSQIAIFIDYY